MELVTSKRVQSGEESGIDDGQREQGGRREAGMKEGGAPWEHKS